MENHEIYIKEGLLENLKIIEATEKKMHGYMKNMKETEEQIGKLKTEGKELSVDSVKDQLLALQQDNYYFSLMREHFLQVIATIRELHKMSEVLNVDLGLDEEKDKIVKAIVKDNPFLFVLDKGGDMVLADNSLASQVSEVFNTVANNPEALGRVFEMLSNR